MNTDLDAALVGGIKVGHPFNIVATGKRRVPAKDYLLVYTMLGEEFPWMKNPEFLQDRAKIATLGAEYIPLYQQCVDPDFKAAWDAFVEKFDIKS